MAGQNLWWPYLYFHLPNYAFSVLFYTLFGRFLLGLFLPPDSKNYIYRWFCRLTNWIIRPVALITPSVFPPTFLPPIAAFWIVIARLAFFMIMFAAGLTPRPAPPQ
jgi:hypothetical protein